MISTEELQELQLNYILTSCQNRVVSGSLDKQLVLTEVLMSNRNIHTTEEESHSVCSSIKRLPSRCSRISPRRIFSCGGTFDFLWFWPEAWELQAVQSHNELYGRALTFQLWVNSTKCNPAEPSADLQPSIRTITAPVYILTSAGSRTTMFYFKLLNSFIHSLMRGRRRPRCFMILQFLCAVFVFWRSGPVLNLRDTKTATLLQILWSCDYQQLVTEPELNLSPPQDNKHTARTHLILRAQQNKVKLIFRTSARSRFWCTLWLPSPRKLVF